jgi:transcriptional regulator with XRE-family HTH domain
MRQASSGVMSAGEFHGRVARALLALLAERRVTQAEVARIKGATQGAIYYQLQNKAAMPLSDMETYAKALGMTPAQLLRELARRITAIEASDAATVPPAGYAPSEVMAGVVDDLAMAS